MRGSVIDPSKHTLSDQFKFSFMVSEMLMDELDQSSVTGFVGIQVHLVHVVDHWAARSFAWQEMSAITMGHMSQFSPALGKKAMTIWQDAYPQRPQGMHFLNLPTIMEGIFNIMKSFAKDKMKERLVVHKKGDLTALHEAVGTDILPEELGGTNGTIQDHIGEIFHSSLSLPNLVLSQREKGVKESLKERADTWRNLFFFWSKNVMLIN